ncbi:MAG: hypothetical protein ABIJ11_07330 [Elusimicrobiota bacterium]
MVAKKDYTEQGIQACFSVLLDLMTVLGEFRENIVVVGGSVPPLLIPSAKEKHIGTGDVDIAFDFKHIRPDTYKTILKILKEKDYYQNKEFQPFVFFKDTTDEKGNKITVEINLLTSEYGGTGRGHRHQTIQDIKARKTRGVDLVFDSAVKVKISGRLPGGAMNEVTIKVASIGPFLVTKGMALWESSKEKHAYDIYYCCKYFPGGVETLLQLIKPITNNKLAIEGLSKIRSKFSDINSIGPSWVVDVLEISNSEERERIKREAFELINSLMDKLGIKPFEE